MGNSIKAADIFDDLEQEIKKAEQNQQNFEQKLDAFKNLEGIPQTTKDALATIIQDLVAQMKEFAHRTGGLDEKGSGKAYEMINTKLQEKNLSGDARDLRETQAKLVLSKHHYKTRKNIITDEMVIIDAIKDIYEKYLTTYMPEFEKQLEKVFVKIEKETAKMTKKAAKIFNVDTDGEMYEGRKASYEKFLQEKKPAKEFLKDREKAFICLQNMYAEKANALWLIIISNATPDAIKKAETDYKNELKQAKGKFKNWKQEQEKELKNNTNENTMRNADVAFDAMKENITTQDLEPAFDKLRALGVTGPLTKEQQDLITTAEEKWNQKIEISQ